MKIELHRLKLGDSDDPEIIAGFELGDWSQTPKGQYCKQHFRDLTYICRPNMDTLGFDVIVYGETDAGPALTEYMLRWP